MGPTQPVSLRYTAAYMCIKTHLSCEVEYATLLFIPVYYREHIDFFVTRENIIMNQLLLLVLLLTLLMALYITPGQTIEEHESTDPWFSTETSA